MTISLSFTNPVTASAITITPLPVDPPVINLPIVDLNYTYTVSNGATTITKYKGTGGNVTVPSTLGGAPVTVIGEEAFYGASSVTGITLPASVKELQYGAFYGTSITKLFIPKSTSIINYNAFDNCTKLAAFEVDSANTAFLAVDGVLFDIGKVELVKYPENKAAVSYSIPDGVKLISSYAFRSANNLKNLTAPASLTYVGSGGFIGCDSLETVVMNSVKTTLAAATFSKSIHLTSITLPSGQTEIPNYCFDGCASLTSIQIPATVKEIGKWAFHDCVNLAQANLPPGLTEIKPVTFYNCKSLQSITVPPSVTKIWNGAFTNCINLNSVSIPAAVKEMGVSAFRGCSNLAYANFSGEAPKIGADVFGGTKSTFVIYYPLGKSGWTNPTWYGYPTKSYLKLPVLPILPTRILPSFTIPVEVEPLPLGPFLPIPPLDIDDGMDLLPPDLPPIEPPDTEDDTNSSEGTDVSMEIKLYVGKMEYFINGLSQLMDASPIVRESRTLLPVRYVAEPLGAIPEWDSLAQKVTITQGNTVIELWIDKNIARVNGVEVPIDVNNPNVKPILVPPGRTMLPLRFIGEALGCQVFWNDNTKEAKLIRP